MTKKAIEWDDQADAELCIKAANGDKQAITILIERHQQWLYNIAVRLVLNPADAEDLVQETLIKIITNLVYFEAQSTFRTWAYRILKNGFIDGKRRKLETIITSFSAYGEALDELPLEEFDLDRPNPERILIVEDAKIGCMLGMLLCLDREQRITYVLGEIFEFPSQLASAILEMSQAAFRKRLERARHDMTQFMNDKCGLINKANPCRCDKKTKAFIKHGWVKEPDRLFAADHLKKVRAVARPKAQLLDDLEHQGYADLFKEHPFLNSPDFIIKLQHLFKDAPADSTALNTKEN
jgi:RNA polymerase sigma factor (sigma-70 family)